jgi:hypothetical protein
MVDGVVTVIQYAAAAGILIGMAVLLLSTILTTYRLIRELF